MSDDMSESVRFTRKQMKAREQVAALQERMEQQWAAFGASLPFTKEDLWHAVLERAVGPAASVLTPEDLTRQGIGRLHAQAASRKDVLLAVLVAGLHVRRRA